MGRPIQKKWFGPASVAGAQIVVTGVRWADNTTATNAYIVKQTGSAAYVVSNGVKAEICFMVNANGLGALLPSQCYINVTPFGGSALPSETIAQYRVSTYDVPNSVAREVGDPAVSPVSNYSWSTVPATQRGQADLITATAIPGAILSVAMGAVGYGYFSAPAVTFTGGGIGATGTAVLTNGTVTSVTVGAPGSGYTTGAMTLGAPPAAVTALGTVVLTLDAVTSITVDTAGGYYTIAPIVTISGDGIGATGTAIVSGGVVTSVTIDNGGSGYTTATVAFAAPPASVQATATATVSV